MKAIRCVSQGGPDQLRLFDVDERPPGPEEVQISVAAAGVNFLDILLRAGKFGAEMPSPMGVECAGTVQAIGANVRDFSIGDRVACGTGGLGAYAELYTVDARRVVRLPDAISFETAAAMMMKGLTSEYLLNRAATVSSGDVVLFHAAAGGVGSIACQWAKHLGAMVIGVVGSETKVEGAKAHGCDHVIVSGSENIESRVRAITGGRGVDVVYDSVGQAVFESSLQSLARYGKYISFGQASGPLPSLAPDLLAPKALWFTKTSVYTYTATPEEHQGAAARLFELLTRRAIRVGPVRSFALAQAAEAHELMQSRASTGSIILTP